MRFYIANFLALRLAYSAAMELQTRIEKLKVWIAELETQLNGGDSIFNGIPSVVWMGNKDGRWLIELPPDGEGSVSVEWLDTDGKVRISAMMGGAMMGSTDLFLASVSWSDKDGNTRIRAHIDDYGEGNVGWMDKDGKYQLVDWTLAASITDFAKCRSEM